LLDLRGGVSSSRSLLLAWLELLEVLENDELEWLPTEDSDRVRPVALRPEELECERPLRDTSLDSLGDTLDPLPLLGVAFCFSGV
jgi:hypothetical protein